jgi:pyruvate/2-oxoglutarate dehydrogenase complex dihydrolipoamide acyltransferase (E2) component
MSDIISEIIVPKENANDDYVKIVDWFIEQGDYVKSGSVILEIETSKANVEISAESDGYIEIFHSQGAEIPTNEIIGCIHAEKFSELPDEEMDSTKIENLDKSESFVSDKVTKISNKAKLLIDEFNIGQSVFGDKDFVREIDVLNYLNKADKKDKTTFEKPKK